MSRQDADRAQSIQIGAVLLFGVLVILLASYQAVVVPDQNRQVEASHVETITQQMQEVRNAVVSTPGTLAGRSVTLTLGVEYPSRVFAVNPPPPTGAIRTAATGPERVNATVANAIATDAEAEDFWSGTNRSVNTGGLVYTPGYNEYRDGPTIVYENSLLYHQFPSGNLTRAGQRLIDGREVTLVALNGSVDTTATGSVALDLDAVSASSRRISVRNDTGENVVLDVASGYSASQWETELREDGEFTDQGGYVADVTESPIPGAPFDVVHVELVQGETYTLGMAKVGVGTDVTDEGPAYLIDVEGDGRTIQEGSTTQVVIEPRDRLNNPVPGETVHGSVESGGNGALATSAVETDEDGRAVFQYEADPVDGVASETVQIDFSYRGAPDADYDADAAENASVTVTVENTDGSGVGGGGGGGGGGPITLSWQGPSSQTGVDCPNGPDDTCSIDAGQNDGPTLTAATSPGASGVEVDFSLNDSSIATLDPGSASTDGSGEADTTFDVGQAGPVAVYATGAASGDVIELVVSGAGSLVYNGDASADGSEVSFSLTNNHADAVTFTDFTFNSSSINPSGEIDNTPWYFDSHEVWIGWDGGLPDADVDESGAIDQGATVSFDNGGPMPAGETADVRISDFRQSTGNNREADMAGEDATVTFHYEDGDGTAHTLTVPMTNIPN